MSNIRESQLPSTFITEALSAISGSRPDIIAYPSKDENGEGHVIGARVPLTWLARINEILRRPGFPWGTVLNNQSAFVRWAVGYGIDRLTTLLDETQSDPVMIAMAFQSNLAARAESEARIIQNLQASVSAIADGVEVLVAHGEKWWAAEKIDECTSDALKLTPNWQFLFIKMLLTNSKLLSLVHSLMIEGVLINDLLVSVGHSIGVLEDIELSSSSTEERLVSEETE